MTEILYCQSPALFLLAASLLVAYLTGREHKVRAFFRLLLCILCAAGGVALYFLGMYKEYFTIRDFFHIRTPGWVGLAVVVFFLLLTLVRAFFAAADARRKPAAARGGAGSRRTGGGTAIHAGSRRAGSRTAIHAGSRRTGGCRAKLPRPLPCSYNTGAGLPARSGGGARCPAPWGGHDAARRFS